VGLPIHDFKVMWVTGLLLDHVLVPCTADCTGRFLTLIAEILSLRHEIKSNARNWKQAEDRKCIPPILLLRFDWHCVTARHLFSYPFTRCNGLKLIGNNKKF